MSSTSTLMTRPAPRPLLYDPHADRPTATVEIVLPVYNEEAELEQSVRRLHAYLTARFPLSWLVTIADNASTDATWTIACRLAQELDGVRAAHLDAKGRGRALRAVWSNSASPVVAYMDIDLSTGLDALLPLVAPLVSGHSDIAIGSRLARSARVHRGPKREAISRTYNLILRTTLKAGFSDAQCGFKAARADAVRALLPLVRDDGWFFDTELLVLAEHNGLRIHEVPVDWVDDADSRVHIASTARDDLRGVWRMLRQFVRGDGRLDAAVRVEATAADRPLTEQLVRFASIGIVSTVVFAILFALLAPVAGVVAADIVALAACTFANTAANRRLTFSLSGRRARARHHARGLAVGLLPLSLNLLALGAAWLLGVGSTAGYLLALTVSNAIGAAARFSLLQRWVFAPARPR
jgi:putative flippase GtrA